MMFSARSAVLAALLCHGVIGGPAGRMPQHVLTGDGDGDGSHHGDGSAHHQHQAGRKLQGRFLHITDIHPDEFYKVHSSTAEADACHRGTGPAGTYGAETSDCDTPWSLVNATFDYIEANLKDKIDFVIWTGDSARHDSDERTPRSQSQVLGSNRRVARKFAETFADQTGRQLGVPVVPTLGNNDFLPHNIFQPGPNKWLRYYADIWAPFIPEEQRHSFEFGGWFHVEVIPGRLAVVSLNTMYFFDRNAAVDDCVDPSEPGFKQMEWLRVQLQLMRTRGVKAILVGHVPPARTDSKQLWDESCWQKYTLWLRQFRDVVVGGVYGHMNVDHFMLQDTKDIDYDILGVPGGVDGGGGDGGDEVFVRESMEDELSIESTADYLQELRERWAKLPKPQRVSSSAAAAADALVGDDDEDLEEQGKKKHRKGKKRKGRKGRKGGPWGERYQLTLVGPSVVPNYLPTLRVFEYNISGLEDAPVWADAQKPLPLVPSAEGLDGIAEPDGDGGDAILELRHEAPVEEYMKERGGGRGGKGDDHKKKKKKKKGRKSKKPKDPNLVVPSPPAERAPPGPAYSPQPLTFTGYTQYYANLTYINNNIADDDDGDGELDESRWRRGKHRGGGGGEPPNKGGEPREFGYEVEYSTFEDGLFGLADLTVGSYAELAWRMGRDAKARGKGVDGGGVSEVELEEEEEEEDADEEDGDGDGDGTDEEDEDEDEHEDGVGAQGKKKHKKKGRKHHRKKHNKVWLHFLQHAFVGTVERKDLKKLDH